MHIIIVGGGKVGRELAAELPTKGHSVVVVEKDPIIAKRLTEELDVLVINEDGANMATLKKAKIRQADIFIAVTQIDELNLMTCMMAKNIKVPVAIARVRNPESQNNIADTGFSQEEIGVDYIINPEKETAVEMSKIVDFPDAVDIEYFANGKIVIYAVIVNKGFEMAGQTIYDIPLPDGCIIVGIKRTEGNFIVPSGKDKIMVGDKVYLVGSAKVIREASRFLHSEQTVVKKVLILGGDAVGYNLASILEKNSGRNLQVKLIEKDEIRCEELNRILKKTVVLQGDTTEMSYYNDEELTDADMIVAVTGDDQTNLIAAIMGEKLGAKIVVSEISNVRYSSVYETVDIDNYINPHLITASKILRFTRGKSVQEFSLLRDENVEALEVLLPASCLVDGKKVMDAGLPRGVLIGALIRNDEIIIPDGQTVLQPGDDLIVFTLSSISNKLERFFCAVP